jgi:hypothetical protein
MSKAWKPGKKTVELKPEVRGSKIRREPAPADNALAKRLDRIDWSSREWEIRLAVAGIILFALALWAITLGASAITSN